MERLSKENATVAHGGECGALVVEDGDEVVEPGDRERFPNKGVGGRINRWSVRHNWVGRAAAWEKSRACVELVAIAKAYSGATERWAGFLKCKIALKTVLILPFSMPV